MPTIAVFEPALCCNTGVCGEDVDQNLVTFTADMAWLLEQGASITRHNLANDPLAFAHNEAVRSFLEIAGSAGLPLVSVDGVTVVTGRYPDTGGTGPLGRPGIPGGGAGRRDQPRPVRGRRIVVVLR